MTLEQRQAAKEACNRSTKGPWEYDYVKNEGEFGSGDETHAGFNSYQMFTEDGRVLFDSLNSTATEVRDDVPEDAYTAWDEVASRNFEFIALARTALPAALDALDAKDREIERLREALGEVRNRIVAHENHYDDFPGEHPCLWDWNLKAIDAALATPVTPKTNDMAGILGQVQAEESDESFLNQIASESASRITPATATDVM